MSEAVQSFASRARDWFADARANPRFRWAMAGAAALILADQLSKHWIVNILKLPEQYGPCAKKQAEVCRQIPVSPIFDLTYVENAGASFGMLAGGMFSRVLLTVIAAGVSVWLAIWLGRLARNWAAAGAAFIIGGALGNMIDRVRYGYVVDFLDFSGLYFPWVFNVADMSINAGIACLLIDAFLTRERAPKPPKS